MPSDGIDGPSIVPVEPRATSKPAGANARRTSQLSPLTKGSRPRRRGRGERISSGCVGGGASAAARCTRPHEPPALVVVAAAVSHQPRGHRRGRPPQPRTARGRAASRQAVAHAFPRKSSVGPGPHRHECVDDEAGPFLRQTSRSSRSGMTATSSGSNFCNSSSASLSNMSFCTGLPVAASMMVTSFSSRFLKK